MRRSLSLTLSHPAREVRVVKAAWWVSVKVRSGRILCCQEFDLPLQNDVSRKAENKLHDPATSPYIPPIPAHLSLIHPSFAPSRIPTPFLLSESPISPTSDKSRCRADRAQCPVWTNRAMPRLTMMARRSRRCCSQQTRDTSV